MSEESFKQWQHRLAGLVLGLTVIILPITIDPYGWDAWRFPKVLVVRSAALLLITIYLAAQIWYPKRPTLGMFSRDWILVLGLVIVGWTALSAALSPQPDVSWWAWLDVAAGFALLFAARDCARYFRDERLLLVFLLPGLINAGVLFVEDAGIWTPLVRVEELADYEDAEMLRKSALSGNRNDSSLYLLIPFSVSVALLFSDRRWLRLAGGGTAVILGASIVVTTTITAIVAATAICWVAAAMYMTLSRRAVAVRVLVLLLLPALGVGILLSQRDVSRRIAYYASKLEAGQWGSASGSRVGPYLVAATAAAERPLIGIGPGRFPIEYVERSIEVRERYPGIVDRGEAQLFDMVHNDYLETAAEAGLVVLAAALALMAVIGGSSLRRVLKGEGRTPAMAVLLALISSALAALILFPMQLAGVYGTIAILIGWGSDAR